MNIVKILLCSPSLTASGGIATWTRHILKYNETVENGQVKLLHFPLEREYFIDPTTTPILKRIIYGIKDYWEILFRFRKEIKDRKPKLVHITTSASFGLIRDLIMVFILKGEKTKSAIHFHFGRIPELKEKKNWEWFLINYLVKNTNATIVIDDKSYKILTKAGHNNVWFLPNPIPSNLLFTSDQFNNFKRSNRNILFVGHLVKTKGIFELVKACINITNIKLKLIGEAQPDITEELLRLALEKGDREWIEVIPNQSSAIVIQEMLSAALFVLPSYTEGFPNVILESMACGCPIIATSVGAIPEMLNCNSYEEAGICIDPQNVDALHIAINRMLDDKSFAKKCGENARRRVEEKYGMPVVWNQVMSIWQNVLKE